MPDREFIHTTSDVASTLMYALDSGLQAMLDAPQPESEPRMLDRSEVVNIERGCFELFRPEWVFGALETTVISSGYNRGKYFVQPRVNYAGVSLYFHGERMDHGRRRLGGAAVSFHREWLEVPAKIVRATPPEVEVWFKRIVAQLSSGITVMAGVHKYHISKGVMADPTATECLPPFDFIPWGPEILQHPIPPKG